MRVKAKSVVLGLAPGGAASLVREAPQDVASAAAARGGHSAGVAPFRLVAAVASGAHGSRVPAVAIASSATRLQQPAQRPVAAPVEAQAQQNTAAPPQPLQQHRQQQAQAPPPQRQQEQQVQQQQQERQQQQQQVQPPRPPLPQQQQPVPPAPTTAAGRPVRKRKATAVAEDMVPTDAVLGRGSRARGPGLPPAALPSAAQPTPAQPSPAQLPMRTLGPVPAATAGAAAAAGLPAGLQLQLASMPAPGGGTMRGLAVPAAALLAMQQQLLRAQGAAAVAAAAAKAAGAGSYMSPPAARGVMPYKLVPPGGAAAPTAGSGSGGGSVEGTKQQKQQEQQHQQEQQEQQHQQQQQEQQHQQQQQEQQHQQVPVVRVAAPRDIVHLSKQLDDEERKRALAAASDARVVLRVLPGSQQAPAGRGGRGGGLKPAGRASGRGRRSSGRQSRRPTPELFEPRPANLPPGTWHPGFECFGGVTYVNVQQSPEAPPLPAVVAGMPPRFGKAVVQGQKPEYAASDDPLRASLEFLHYAARTAGRPPPQYSSEVAAAVSLEQGLYRERLARAHYARDGRRLQFREGAEGTRKSMRMRSAPDAFRGVPAALAVEHQAQRQQQQQQQQQQGQQHKQQLSQQQRGARAKRRTPSPDDDTDVQLGPEHQVELPAVRPRPHVPSEEEARWVSGLVCQAGDVAAPQRDAQQAAVMPAASAEERAAWVRGAHDALCASLGAERAAAMGLLALGRSAGAGQLTEEEEAALEAGMQEFGRAFHTIQLEQVPSRTVFELQNHYYNSWKLRATPRSKAWYKRKAAEEAQRQAEQERLEAAAAAEQEAQRQRQEQRHKRRMLREVVTWVKGAARAPAEAPNRPTVLQRVQRAAKLIGSMNAEAGAG